MNVRLLPAVVAGIVALAVAALLFVPYVAREYRRRGELRVRTVALPFCALLCGLGLLAYVLLPLPSVGPGFCAAFEHIQPQWRPLASLDGIQRPRNWAELPDVLTNGAQFGYNIALFVPLGMLVRRTSSLGKTALAGFTVSLCIELTQLTGLWWLYPCPYRLFDVDDLIANTCGAMAGAAFAPLRYLFPERPEALESSTPRPVTTGRRLLGMACDLLLLWWLGTALLNAVELVLNSTHVSLPADVDWLESTALWFVPALLLLLIMALGGGSTLGQQAVLSRTASPAGNRGARLVLRWMVGLGGLALGEGLINVTPWPELGTVFAMMWCTVHAFGVTKTRHHRGISGALTGLNTIDARLPRQGSTHGPALPIDS